MKSQQHTINSRRSPSLALGALPYSLHELGELADTQAMIAFGDVTCLFPIRVAPFQLFQGDPSDYSFSLVDIEICMRTWLLKQEVPLPIRFLEWSWLKYVDRLKNPSVDGLNLRLRAPTILFINSL